jgi:hypothetical protein
MASADAAAAAIHSLDLTDHTSNVHGLDDVDDLVLNKHLLPLLGVRHLSILSQVNARLNRLCLHEFKRVYLESYSVRKDPLIELRGLEWYRSQLLELESRRYVVGTMCNHLQHALFTIRMSRSNVCDQLGAPCCAKSELCNAVASHRKEWWCCVRCRLQPTMYRVNYTHSHTIRSNPTQRSLTCA